MRRVQVLAKERAMFSHLIESAMHSTPQICGRGPDFRLFRHHDVRHRVPHQKGRSYAALGHFAYELLSFSQAGRD